MRSNAFVVIRKSLRLGRLAVALALGVALVSPGSPVVAQSRGRAAASKLDSELRHRIANGKRQEARRLIVRVKPGAAQRAQGLFKALGQKVRQYNPSINAYALDAGDAEALAQSGDIESISLDAVVRASRRRNGGGHDGQRCGAP